MEILSFKTNVVQKDKIYVDCFTNKVEILLILLNYRSKCKTYFSLPIFNKNEFENNTCKPQKI